MSDVAISVENLGKEYRIGTRERHDTLRDAVAGVFRRRQDHRPCASERGTIDHGPSSIVHGPSGGPSSMVHDPSGGPSSIVHGPSGGPSSMVHGPASETFWALKDVSFEVRQGEVVGIIGRNGAGKSTLLKILSRITEPTTGRAVIHGRVGSLLEVGTGFHPELTGRENIYLNGAILGMRRAEIDRRFDEIVAFSEIEKFLDTPVKHYSSGMYVRLAFAVAAHLDPEVLIVDEVLVVGDAAFQKKCLGKMGDVAGEGRTVIFVSHNMAAIGELCPRTLLVVDGSLAMDGATRTSVDLYLNGSGVGSVIPPSLGDVERPASGLGSLLRFTGASVNRGGPVQNGMPVEIDIAFVAQANVSDVSFGIGFSTPDGTRILTVRSDFTASRSSYCEGQAAVVRATIPSLGLCPGEYVLDMGASSGAAGLDHLNACLKVKVEPSARTPAWGVADGYWGSADWTLVDLDTTGTQELPRADQR